MATLEDFHTMVGKTIMECQGIEHDVKLIFAGMLKGDFQQNFLAVKDKPLGDVLIDLQQLDNSDDKPFLSRNDYRLLHEIRTVRNWLAHEAYIDFMYDSKGQIRDSFTESYHKCLDFYNRMKKLSLLIEDIRLTILKHFNRI